MPGPKTETGPNRAALLVLALVMLLALGGWRAFSVLNAPAGQVSGSALEQSTLQLAETVTGAGKARISVTYKEGGAKTWLILVDGPAETASGIEAQLEPLIRASGAFNPARDTLTIRQYVFAPGVSAAPTPLEYAELTVFLLLAGMLAYTAFAPRAGTATPIQPVAPKQEPVTSVAEPQRITPRAMPRTPEAASLASADPAGAANVLRGWMNGPEGQA